MSKSEEGADIDSSVGINEFIAYAEVIVLVQFLSAVEFSSDSLGECTSTIYRFYLFEFRRVTRTPTDD